VPGRGGNEELLLDERGFKPNGPAGLHHRRAGVCTKGIISRKCRQPEKTPDVLLKVELKSKTASEGFDLQKLVLGTVLLRKQEASVNRVHDYRKRTHLIDLGNTPSGKASARKPKGQL